ncbi:sensor histidine kinase [Butyrivibrio sp. MC2013]|uniref:sensor histidine kinase n=1 Tax=Butyrivibrio sp. MC2013 TaxID=1280686 RepID=UPI000684A15A|nr:HAMP domain-containing sensor histidine kinase [Butyrivibrio sp. MC2013]
MINKFRIRLQIYIFSISVIVFGVLFFSIPFIEYKSSFHNAQSALEMVLLTPGGMLTSGSSDDFSDYTLFEVDPIGAVTKIYSKKYNRNDAERIYREILKDQIGKKTMRIDSWGVYYIARSISGGTRCALADASSDIAYSASLKRTCAALWLLSSGISFFLALFVSGWATKPAEIAINGQREFIADASHELKTPLTVIMTNAELLDKDKGSPEQKKRYVENILTESRQMRDLIRNLLDLTKLDQQISKEDFEVLDYSKLVSDSCLTMEAELFEKGHELISDIQERICMKGDPSMLRQIMDILLDNAGKYADPGTPIRVVLRQNDSHRISLQISNSAPDMSPETLQNIFHRFYRTDKARSRNGSYGLGLAIARRLTDLHKGSIYAESRNHIVTFHVRFQGAGCKS